MVREMARETWPVHTAPVVADHLQEQGWELLADGTIHFDDEGEIEPTGHVVPAHSNDLPGGTR